MKKKPNLTLCFFIDALGWKILSENPEFLKNRLLYKRKLRTILGYSSACDPSIISGVKPSEHGHWSSFFYSPKSCDYQWTKWLAWLPQYVSKRQKVRHYLSRFIKKIQGYTGYFQIYQVPFSYLPYFDYAEKNRIWVPGGLNKGRSIFDELHDNHIPYYVGDQDSESKQVIKVKQLIECQSIRFAYLLFGKLDAVMHMNGTHHDLVSETLAEIEKSIDSVIELAEKYYEQVDYYVFSDHGMHNVIESHNLQKLVEGLRYSVEDGLKYGLQSSFQDSSQSSFQDSLTYGVDYIGFYDSTMARFWFFNQRAKGMIIEMLNNCDFGRILSDEELKSEGVYFPDHQYGDLVFLMKSGHLIIPSFMGIKSIPGMHGYDPDDEDSFAMIGSNRVVPDGVKSIEQIYGLLKGSSVLCG